MMRRLCVLSLLLLCLLPTSSAPVAAQAADCNPAPLYEQAAKLKPSGDAKNDIADLSKLADSIRQTSITCNGFKFEGKSNQVIGPFELPKGTWLVTLTIKGNFGLDGTLLDGKCTEGGYAIENTIFYASTGEAIDGMGVVIKSEGCRLLLTTESADEPWTLTFEPIS